ncbi:MAG TPA: metallophosphoesterase family protein [Saprospiraceae bacterium]|nr:metallophosphoesterase family protein [Saprospiraceae bacterium]
MERIFVVGDIHGCSRTFRKLVLEEINLQRTDELYCLGDYVDRGPDSKGVIDFILDLQADGYSVKTLRGNHDQMMMESGQDNEHFLHWARNGGLQTLDSFGIQNYSQLESKYKTFFYETAYYYEVGKYILVHAGLNFHADDPFADTESMMWIRGFKVNDQKLGDRIIVHGHTPIPLNVILTQRGENIIDIDGGCVYTRFEGMGHLVALDLVAEEFIAVPNVE